MLVLALLIFAALCAVALSFLVHSWSRRTIARTTGFLRESAGMPCPDCDALTVYEITAFNDEDHKYLCASCGYRYAGEPIVQAS